MEQFKLVIIIGLLVFTSCSPCEKLAKKCPSHVTDSISYIETVKLDTLVLISPADTTYIELPVFTLEDLGIIVENADQEITIAVNDGVFTAQVICKDDSLIAIIAEKEKLLSEQKTVIKEVEVEVLVKHVPKFYKIAALFAFCCVVLLVVYLYIKIKGGAFRSALNRLK